MYLKTQFSFKFIFITIFCLIISELNCVYNFKQRRITIYCVTLLLSSHNVSTIKPFQENGPIPLHYVLLFITFMRSSFTSFILIINFLNVCISIGKDTSLAFITSGLRYCSWKCSQRINFIYLTGVIFRIIHFNLKSNLNFEGNLEIFKRSMMITGIRKVRFERK